MTHFPQPQLRRRATRIQMPKPVSAIVVCEDGRHTNCKLQTVSVTGGLLQVGQPIGQDDFVELAFQTTSSTVHGMAKMLSPMPTPGRVMQPFCFIALDDDDHRKLQSLADLANDPKTFRTVSVLRQL
jgi:hypothetical protein